MKSIYALQPYHVGSKNGRSLALILPAKVTRECDISTSTVFALRVNEETKKITLQIIDKIIDQQCKNSIPYIGEDEAASNLKSS